MTDLLLQIIFFSIPSLIYLAVQRRRALPWGEIFKNLGWQASPGVYFLWALGVVAVSGLLGWLAYQIMPPEIFEDPGVNVSAYQGWSAGLSSFLLVWLRESIYIALGEEIFFRGFLGGILNRRCGFLKGNLLQALAFMLPHLFLLLVSLQVWPILIVQFIAGWLLGWLRYRSGSILPGWIAHSLVNALGALAVMT